MSVAPNAGIVDFSTFLSPAGGQDGVQGQVPAPLAAEVGYVLSTNGWVPSGGGGGSGTVTSVALDFGTLGLTVSGSPITTSGTFSVAGTLVVANGGTGATDAGTARTNLSAQKVITSGTTAPTGGVDGDIYLQYT